MEDKNIKHITFNNEIYASIFDIRNIPEGLDFLTNDESFIQVGTWNYKKDKILDAHYHNYFERSSYVTQEIVYVLQGKIKCNLYQEDTTYIDFAIVESGMMIDNIKEYMNMKCQKIQKFQKLKMDPIMDQTKIEQG